MNRPNLQKRPEEEFRVTLKGSLVSALISEKNILRITVIEQN
jgi:hypothetical protein